MAYGPVRLHGQDDRQSRTDYDHQRYSVLTQLCLVLSQITRLTEGRTDRQTDRQTDTFLVASSSNYSEFLFAFVYVDLIDIALRINVKPLISVRKSQKL